ncbi:hypothetical protein ACS126_01680 [Sphingobacterium lactis]|uniref:hypothetical protein n=1 Tax=Sphingobacterium lactis TaxID=797291 RepID=UPI003EC8A421
MERLTIKELAPYLPYKLKVKTRVGDKILEMMSLSTVTHKGQICIETYDGTFGDMWFKPLLRPLSSLTEEIEHNGERFVPKDRLRKISGAFEPEEEFKNTFTIHMVDGFVTGFSALCMHVNQLELFNKLHEWHFDTANLLGRGLALPIDGKEVEG